MDLEKLRKHPKCYYPTDNGVLLCGDCLEIMPELEPVGLAITSPPYNMMNRVRSGKYVKARTDERFRKKYKYFDDALSIEEYYHFHNTAISEILRLAPILFWNIQIVTGSKEAIFRLIGTYNKQLKDIIVWDKGFGQPAIHKGVLNRGYELILIFERNAKIGRCFNESYFDRGTMQDVWKISRGRNHKSHSACFPVELAMKIIMGWGPQDAVVLDPFVGTGTTALACERLNRKWIGIEKEEKYCEISAKRIEKEAAQLKLW